MNFDLLFLTPSALKWTRKLCCRHRIDSFFFLILLSFSFFFFRLFDKNRALALNQFRFQYRNVQIILYKVDAAQPHPHHPPTPFSTTDVACPPPPPSQQAHPWHRYINTNIFMKKHTKLLAGCLHRARTSPVHPHSLSHSPFARREQQAQTIKVGRTENPFQIAYLHDKSYIVNETLPFHLILVARIWLWTMLGFRFCIVSFASPIRRPTRGGYTDQNEKVTFYRM